MNPTDCPRWTWLVHNDYFNPLDLANYPCLCGSHTDRQPSTAATIAAAMPDAYAVDAYGVAAPKGL